jgi:hypothetical protein
MCSGSACSLAKGEFLKIRLGIFLCHCIETMRTNPIYPVGRHCHDVFSKVEVGSVVVRVALLIIVNT